MTGLYENVYVGEFNVLMNDFLEKCCEWKVLDKILVFGFLEGGLKKKDP